MSMSAFSRQGERSLAQSFEAAASDIAALCDEAIAGGAIDGVANDALGEALAAMVRLYVAKAEAGERLQPFGRNSTITATEIAIASLAMLDAGRMEVFELGLWEQMSDIRPARHTTLADEGATV